MSGEERSTYIVQHQGRDRCWRDVLMTASAAAAHSEAGRLVDVKGGTARVVAVLMVTGA